MPRKTVDLIKQALREGDFVYSIHRAQSAFDRIVTHQDVKMVGKTCQTAKLQKNGTYKIAGFDDNDIELTVVCRVHLKRRVLIVTLY